MITGSIPNGFLKRIYTSVTSPVTVDTTVPTGSEDTKSLKVAHPGVNVSNFIYIDDRNIGGTDIVLQADIMATAIGSDSSTGKIGLVARYSNNGMYAAYMRPQTNIIRIVKITGGASETVLQASSAISPTLAANTWYTLKFSVVGTALKAKIWVKGTAEPSSWNIDITDSTYTVGKSVGIFSNQNPDTWNAYVTNFKSIDTISRVSV